MLFSEVSNQVISLFERLVDRIGNATSAPDRVTRDKDVGDILQLFLQRVCGTDPQGYDDGVAAFLDPETSVVFKDDVAFPNLQQLVTGHGPDAEPRQRGGGIHDHQRKSHSAHGIHHFNLDHFIICRL